VQTAICLKCRIALIVTAALVGFVIGFALSKCANAAEIRGAKLEEPDWSARSAIHYPWLTRAVTLKECDNRQTHFVTTGTMTTVTCENRKCRNFVYENSCAYRRK
jgi:hypothetical protein